MTAGSESRDIMYSHEISLGYYLLTTEVQAITYHIFF